MLIRSQNGTEFVNLDNIADIFAEPHILAPDGSEHGEYDILVLFSFQSNDGVSNVSNIGHYSTLEKAEEVLLQISEAYEDGEKVYQMPLDEEEDA